MSRNDDRLLGNSGHVYLRGANHPINAATGRVINEWVMAVPERISYINDVSFLKFDGDIRIGMRRAIAFQHQRSPVEMKRLVSVNELCGQCTGRRWRKCKVPVLNTRSVAEVLACVFVRCDFGACRMQPLVSISVVEMPVRVD